MPAFIFQINEVREHPNVDETVDVNGHWMPSYVRGYNQPVTEGVTGTWWMCNGNRIWPLPGSTPPQEAQVWKTYSVFFCGGHGFRVMRGNATDPSDGQAYHPLAFEHHSHDNWSSYLTNVMGSPTLCCHREDQVWTRMLLPNTYHGSLTAVQQYGGLKGELPIFLALIAFSMPPDHLRTYLPAMMHNGAWQQFTMQNGWIHKRGVVVTVYTFSGGSSAADLRHAEEGNGQRYYG
ncbi:hypothetical protein SVAN01_05921 [Stagonosporopsis vannaccii]|nr:hypothetical protein SVAN01_05921 [Stagonosporopsis vannaccii]